MPAYQIRNGNQLFDTAGRQVGVRLPSGEDQMFTLASRSGAAADLNRAQRRATHKREAASPALNQAPAWAAGTAVVLGQVYRLSTKQLLVCTTAGTTHATTEPTITAGSAPAEITDNTAKWWPLQENTRTPIADAPTVTITDNAGGSVRNAFNIYNNPSLFESASAPNLHTPGGAGSFTRSTAWTVTDGTAADGGAGAGKLCKFRTTAFVTADDVIEIGYFASISADFKFERVQFDIVDLTGGYPVTEYSVSPGAQGSSRFWKLTIAGGRRKRLIRIRNYGGSVLTYVAVAADLTVEKPPVRSLTSMVFIDSFGDTEQPTVDDANFSLVPRLSRRLGYPNCQFIGLGGASYTYNDPGSGRKSVQWLLQNNDLSAFSPDLVINAHGYNAGNNGVSASTEATGAEFCWRAQRGLAPTVPVIVVGPHYLKPETSAGLTAVRDALKAKFLAWADPNSAFVDPFDGSVTLGDGTVVQASGPAWINATNSTWIIPSLGGGFDGYHLTIAGRAFYEDCLFAAIDLALNALGQ